MTSNKCASDKIVGLEGILNEIFYLLNTIEKKHVKQNSQRLQSVLDKKREGSSN